MRETIPFIDLAAQRRRIGPAIDAAVLRVLEHGGYIMGPEVKALEADLADFCGAKHVISCANGTDALAMVMMALGVKSGDAVLCPSFTFAATAEVVAWLGATPIFVDSREDSFNLDARSLAAGLKTARDLGLNPVGIIPVDLFGLPADYEEIESFAAHEGLWILCDAAQSFGATYKGRKVGAIGMATTTSFFPAKPLGCYGDGGAIFTNDDALATLLRSIRVHGQGEHKYDNVVVGMNGRLDTVQAAVLVEKLKIFPNEIAARNKVAKRYHELLSGYAAVPEVPEGITSVWAQYTLRLTDMDRDRFAAELKAAGIPTAIYYPKPLHQQIAYKHYPIAGNGLPVAERLAAQVISLPMHPYLEEDLQDHIAGKVIEALQPASAAQAQ